MDESSPTPQPDPLALSRCLRAELIAFVNDAGARRVLPSVFHVGRPGGRRGRDQLAVPEEGYFGPGLRADLVVQCLDSIRPLRDDVIVPWVTRSGDLVPFDSDVAWAAGAREAFARYGRAFPGFFVITRQGWLNLSTGDIAEVRIRRRRARSP